MSLNEKWHKKNIEARNWEMKACVCVCVNVTKKCVNGKYWKKFIGDGSMLNLI